MANITNWTLKNPTASTYENIVQTPNGKSITIVNVLISNQSGSPTTIKFGFFDESDNLLSEYYIGEISNNSTGPDEKNLKIFLDQNQKLKVHSTEETGVYITLSGAITVIDEQNPPSSFTWTGPWTSGTDYNVNNLVSHEGSTYIAKSASQGVEPPNNSYWGLFASAASTDAHASNHISGASDEIDGDKLDIDYSPSNYTQNTSPTEVTIIEHLTAHLKGIDDQLGYSSVGSGLPQILPNKCSFDDSNTGSSRGSAFGMVETIDFESGSYGSVWVTFHFPDTLDQNSDIILDLYYNLNSADDGKEVDWEVKYWIYSDGETPDSGSPTGTNTDTINTGTNEENKRQSINLTNIPSGDISNNNTITLRLTRLGSVDSYTGTFQMLYIYPYQS